MFSGFSSFGGPGGFVNLPQTFEEYFRCYPIVMMNDRIRKDDANYGGKIFLPPSALNKLSMLNIRYPMLFQLTASESGKMTHGGVLEFTAEEGRVYLPQWMMQTLNVQPGSLLKIDSTDVPLGQFVKIEPQSTDFLDISDPKAVLENVLRNFSTLTVDDIIEISYNNKIYGIKVLEVKPESSSRSICVIETDLVTDFAPPVGYVEPDYKALQQKEEEERKKQKENRKFDPSTVGQGSMSTRINYVNILDDANKQKTNFIGTGQNISGKPIKEDTDKNGIDVENLKISLESEPVRLDLPDGQLFFGFPIVLPRKDDKEGESIEKATFKGEGKSLRKTVKRKTNKDHATTKSKSPRSPEVIEID
ncbi:polyubiquitin-binding protein UFD1 NDAI_0B05310 [Naumovozyma dairenensis CBS 421]|uniref:Ubiquitin fusion degradation protein 1 n=1 Tax=Naumovozyma dairenensis (strain ATCC 10597 / BCRC 20456 / CBS 421 / NBRC 0211 / NRRL Y-12639) TaxID=1071378 RepID=G0W703_NAUDC|nr:hypothetical protein NDAI_0B05310 [Naumovozyma dairenensis CBS 421]CCD23564.1 hypothetical protein NDAI_0B05310 [Naumovozyma dairenensis CBS 421]